MCYLDNLDSDERSEGAGVFYGVVHPEHKFSDAVASCLRSRVRVIYYIIYIAAVSGIHGKDVPCLCSSENFQDGPLLASSHKVLSSIKEKMRGGLKKTSGRFAMP